METHRTDREEKKTSLIDLNQRGSRDIPSSSWVQTLISKFCPCFSDSLLTEEEKRLSVDVGLAGHSVQKRDHSLGESQQEYSSSKNNTINEQPSSSKGRRVDPLFRSVTEKKTVDYQLQQYFQRRLSNKALDNQDYPVLRLREEDLIVIGGLAGRMLTRVSTVRIQPPKRMLIKTQQIMEKQKDKSHLSNPKLDKFWMKRYLIFQKFDHGIKLDEESWYSITPEAVSSYISERVKCTTILDAFCGAGGDAIKFANTCHTVLANDKDVNKLKCLSINSEIYGVYNIITFNHCFLELQPSLKCDVVYIAPPWGQNYNSQTPMDPFTTFKPEMDKVLKKALSIASNVVLLMPPNIIIQSLGPLFSRCVGQSLPKNSSCAVEIQKIYYMHSLKFVLVFYGSTVTKHIKLTDELNFIYKMLKDNGDEGRVFQHKKVIKEVRENYGMVSLLNYVYECRKFQKGSIIDNFYELIRAKKLISAQKMEMLVRYQNKATSKIKRTWSSGGPTEKSDVDSKRTNERDEDERTNSFVTNDEESQENPRVSQNKMRGTIILKQGILGTRNTKIGI